MNTCGTEVTIDIHTYRNFTREYSIYAAMLCAPFLFFFEKIGEVLFIGSFFVHVVDGILYKAGEK